MSRAACWPVIVVAVAVFGTVMGCSEPVKAPTAYKKWNAKDGTFALEYPEGWNAEGGGAMGIQWAEFKKGSCVISIDTNLSAAIIADAPGPDLGEGADPKLVEQMAPAARSHNWVKSNDPSRFEPFKNYKEDEPTKISPPLGEGRKSLFTASKGGKIKGYRITIPTNQKALIVFAYGPEKDWPKLQAAYDKIFDGVEFGTPP